MNEVKIEDVKSVVDIISPIVNPLIESLIKPQIKKLNSWLDKTSKESDFKEFYWEDRFYKYIKGLYEDSLFVTTLVFPNSQTRLKDLYIPLTLSHSNNHSQFKVKEFDFKIFDSCKKILISDYAGMGKSTLLKWISVSIIEQSVSIPILIELRKISDTNTLLDEIISLLNPIDNSIDDDLIYEFLDLGLFTILLDGFDEIPYDIQDKVTSQIKKFILKTNNNNFIITSRPESALSTFSDFQMFHISPLIEKEAYTLIEKLDSLSKVKFGSNLIAEIKDRNTQVKEFLTNPFLVSLLYKSYTYNKDIPSKKITFYEEVYSCLFKHHDLSKEGFKRPKRSRLDIFDFEIILRDIAFNTSKVGIVIYTQDEIIYYIQKAKTRNLNIDFKEINYLEDLTTTVPIFSNEGLKIKWAHKSIQDFFSAKYISNHSKKADIISALFKSNKFHYLNILDLLYELEYKLFRKIIVKPILEEFIQFYESTFKDKGELDKSLIDERISLMFASKFCFIRVSKDIGFDNAKAIFKKSISQENDFAVSSLRTNSAEYTYYTMNELSLKKQLIKILKNKNEDLFSNELSSGRNRAIIGRFQIDKAYIVNDNLIEEFNLPENFGSFNELMRDKHKERFDNEETFYLDYQKCKSQLNKINIEIISEDSQELLLEI